MEELKEIAEKALRQEFDKVGLTLYDTDKGFAIEAKSGQFHEIYLQPLDLDKERSVKILKSAIEIKETTWIALVLYMEEMQPVIYLIPTKVFDAPDDYIFVENKMSALHSFMDNWEIKVFRRGIEKLSKYSFDYMVKELS